MEWSGFLECFLEDTCCIRDFMLRGYFIKLHSYSSLQHASIHFKISVS